MKITPTKISDAKLIEPKMFGDERGFFIETWNEKVFRGAGIDTKFEKENHSRSVKNNLRVGSETFDKWVGKYFSEEYKTCSG